MVADSKSSDTRKIFSKYKGEEEPVVVAQRFLNIFRQLHIFDDQRKEAFKQMILEQPPEIRGMFSSLPGGSLLQEYVDELEQEAGVVREKTAIPSSQIDEEVSKAKILATALAEAQVQAASQVQNTIAQPQIAPAAPIYAAPPIMAPQANNQAHIDELKQKLKTKKEQLIEAKNNQDATAFKKLQKECTDITEELKYLTSPTPAGYPAITPNISIDDNFAKTLASAIANSMKEVTKTSSSDISRIVQQSQTGIAEILKQNAEIQKSETMQITKALTETQLEVAKMVIAHSNINATANNNANNIQINTGPVHSQPGAIPMAEYYEVGNGGVPQTSAPNTSIEAFIKAQSELYREVSNTQTRDISSIISFALKESNQLSTNSIIEAIKEMQKENRELIKFLAENNNFQRVEPQTNSNTNQQEFEEWDYEDEPVEEIAEEVFEDAPSDEEWEYVEDEAVEPVEEIAEEVFEDAPSDEEWEYVEDEAVEPIEEIAEEVFEDAPSDEEWEYVEDEVAEPVEDIAEEVFEDAPSDEEWEYVEDEIAEPVEEIAEEVFEDAPSDEEWEYVEDEVAEPVEEIAEEVFEDVPSDEEWEYVEDEAVEPIEEEISDENDPIANEVIEQNNNEENNAETTKKQHKIENTFLSLGSIEESANNVANFSSGIFKKLFKNNNTEISTNNYDPSSLINEISDENVENEPYLSNTKPNS